MALRNARLQELAAAKAAKSREEAVRLAERAKTGETPWPLETDIMFTLTSSSIT